ncbi:hypothetical protein AB0395_46210 [Streptosporangium sp. NPDC051023]
MRIRRIAKKINTIGTPVSIDGDGIMRAADGEILTQVGIVQTVTDIDDE